jgi:hypothetical protein
MTSASTAEKPVRRKKRRVFLWVFLAVQALFIIWIITGASSSAAPCHGLSSADCKAASDAGKGIGVVVIVVFWCVVDFLLAVIYGVYRLARRTT